MAAIPFVITNAGLSLISGGGAVNLTTLQLGTGAYTVSSPSTANALTTPISTTLTLVGSSTPGTGLVSLAFEDLTTNAYSASEMAIFTSTGVLFAIYAQTTPIVSKTSGSAALFSIDLALTNSQATSVTVPSIPAFNYPAATTATAGVAKIATQTMVNAGTDATTIVTPATLFSFYEAPLVGMVASFSFPGTPPGWVRADGSPLSRSAYAALFAAIGTTYGTGDGTTTFNVPDLRGYFVRGWDNSRGVDPGRAVGTSQADQFGSHTHTFTVPDSIGDGSGDAYASTYAADNPNYTRTTSAAGGSETRPKNIALNYCIKY